MITCPACQQQESEGEYFCSHCGARLAGVEQPATFTFNPVRLENPSRPAVAPAQPSPEVPPRHVMLHIRGAAHPLVLPARAEYLLGREGDDQVFPDVNLGPYRGRELGVSRTHALLRIVHQKLFLLDLGSTNGTRINGELLSARQPTLLENGDEIRLGKLSLTIHFNLETGS